MQTEGVELERLPQTEPRKGPIHSFQLIQINAQNAPSLSFWSTLGSVEALFVYLKHISLVYGGNKVRVPIKNPKTGELKEIKCGWSWTLFSILAFLDSRYFYDDYTFGVHYF